MMMERKRGFDIMGNVGDQFGFHTLVFHAFLHRRIQSGTDIIDVFRHGLLVSKEPFRGDFMLQFSAADPFQAVQDDVPSAGSADQIYQGRCVKERQQEQKSCPSAENDRAEKELHSQKDYDNGTHLQLGGSIF